MAARGRTPQGSIRKNPRSGSFEVRVAGKSRSAPSKRAAERLRREMLIEHEVALARSGEQVDMTVAELLDRWLIDTGHRVATRTLHGYKTIARQIVDDDPRLAEMQTVEVRPIDIENHTQAVSANRGPATARATHRVLSTVFSLAERWELIRISPVRHARTPKVPRREQTVPTPTQVRMAIEAADPGFAVLIRVAIVTGCRRSEIAALKWEDVDFESRTLKISKAIDTTPGAGGDLKSTKTHASVVMGIDEATLAQLTAHRDAQLAAPPHGHIWSRHDDGVTPIRPDRITALWAGVRSQVPNLDPNVRFHDLRHATATWAIADGIDPRAVADHLRHASITMTLDVYTAAVTRGRTTGQRVAGILDGNDAA